MKRTFACIIALALSVEVAAAQGGIALKGGLSYGNVSNAGVLPGSLDTRTGFAVGLALGPGHDVLGIGVEGLYAQRGVTSSSSPASESKLDYIDVPVFLRAMFPSPGIAPFAYAGPQLSFELRCRAGGSACPDSGRPSTTYAAVLGGGVRLGGSSAISIEG